MKPSRLIACLGLVVCAATILAQTPAGTKPPAVKQAEEQALRKTYPWYHPDLFDESRRDVLEAALAGPMKTDQEIVFACRTTIREHWYANFGYFAEGDSKQASVPIHNTQGRLCRLNLRTGKLTILLEDLTGAVRDPCVHYDGGKIVFSYRKGGTDAYHLYTINSDGIGLRQMTDGPFDDIEPAYLPDGGIAFCSSRSKRWVNCWCTPVATLHRCDGEGHDIRPLSANIEHDNTPAVLPDGRILYTRWEYVDRSQLEFHHLWTIKPDGSGQMTFFGNMNPGGVLIDARPIPGTTKIIMIHSPGHGRPEHQGGVSILDPGNGPDARESERVLSNHPWFHDPYPVSGACFLVAVGDRLAMMNDAGRVNVLYRLPTELMAAGMEVHEPRWLTPRPRELVITPRTNDSSPTGTLVMSDVYAGRNMAGVARGTVKKLLVMETLPKPLNFSGFPEPLTFGGSFTLERVVGTVPVESDGSAHFELPAHRAFFFVALDKDENAVKRMQSFVSVMPGEVTGCVGCHEERTRTVASNSGVRTAMLRRPSTIQPIEGIPQVFDFPRDIQPILDRHCVSCHNARRREGGVTLTGDRGPLYSHSYFMLTIRQQFADGRNRTAANLPPYQIGAVASPLMKKLQGHHGTNLSPSETRAIRYWIEAGATYPGTYAALGTGMIGGYYKTTNDGGQINEWPEVRNAAEVMGRRCAGCHTGNLVLPDGPCFDRKEEDPYWICGDRNADRWKDPQRMVRLRLSRHLLYNLSRPQDSILLLAPLAREAGGYAAAAGDAPPKTCPPTFVSMQDADYQKILGAICKVSDELNRIKRFDMAGFRPRPEYLREMKRFGVLSATFDDHNDPANPYLIDAKYWQSFSYQPAKLH